MSDLPFIPRARQSESDRKLLAQGRATVEHSRRLLYETQHQTDPYRLSRDLSRNAVSITETCGEWHVLVEQAGHCSTLTFPIEQDAVDFAEGQKTRLGLVDITRAER